MWHTSKCPVDATTNGVWTAKLGDVIQSYSKANLFGKPLCCNIFKVNSHITCPAQCCSPAMQCSQEFRLSFPLDLHSAAVSDSPYHAMPIPRPYRAPATPFWKRLLKPTAQHSRGAACTRHGMCELTLAVGRRPVADLPRFGFFRLPCGVPRRLSSES